MNLTGIVRNILCISMALSGGTVYATIYTDVWTEGTTPASTHNGYITYTYHTDNGIKTMTINPPADGDRFVFTGEKITFMDNASAAAVKANKAGSVVFQNDVWIRNFSLTAPGVPVVTNHFYRNLVGTEYVTVLANANLDDYRPVAIMQDWKDERGYEVDSTSGQHWRNRAQTLNPYHFVRETGKLSFQYQTSRGNLNGRQAVKVIKAEMKQVGADIKMRAIAAYSVYSDDSAPIHAGTFDVDALWIGADKVEEALYTGGDTIGYGINTVALKFIGSSFTMRFEGSGTQHINSARPAANARIELADVAKLEKASYPSPTGGTIAFFDGSYSDFRWYVNDGNKSSTGTFLFETTKATSSPAVTNTISPSMDWCGATPFVVRGIDGSPMLLNMANSKCYPTNSSVTVKQGGILKMSGAGTSVVGVKGGTCDFVVEKGGILQQAAQYVFGTNTLVELNGGKLQMSVDEPYDWDVGTDLPLLTLRNGAVVESVSSNSGKTLRIGRTVRGATWHVGGETPSTNTVAIQFFGPANRIVTNTFNVAKLGDFDADFVCTKGIGIYTGSEANRTNVLRKIGCGTMLVKGNCTVPADTLIEGGTFKLGASAIWRGYFTLVSKTNASYNPDDPPPPIVLCGGDFAAAANTSNGLGRVTLAADSRMTLEEGACFTCYDQSAVAWNEDARLDVTIPTNSVGALLGAIRFGTTRDGLAEDQLRSIRLNGKHAMLDSAGWLRYRQLGTKLIIR